MSTQREQQAQQAANDFLDFLNSSTASDRKEFANEVLRGHRTLQDIAFSSFMLLVEGWAGCDKDGNYDQRNERAVKESTRILNALHAKGV